MISKEYVYWAEVHAESKSEQDYLANVVAQQQNRECKWAKTYLTSTENARKIIEEFNAKTT